MAQPRRFPPAWTVEELDACFIVKDSNEQALGYVYYEVRATYLSYAARKPQHLCAIGKSYVLAPPSTNSAMTNPSLRGASRRSNPEYQACRIASRSLSSGRATLRG